MIRSRPAMAAFQKGNAKMINGNDKAIEGASDQAKNDHAADKAAAIFEASISPQGAEAGDSENIAQGSKPDKLAKPAKAARKGKAKAKAAAKPAAAPKKGLAARMAAQDAGKAKHAEAAAAAKAAQSKLSPGSDIAKDAEFHFSGLAHNMPSASDIEKAEGLCKRMIGRDLARYKDALKGNLPIGEFDGCPIDLNLQTHSGYKAKWKALKALIDAGDLAALEGWNGGLGIRQNSSSSKPLGRFHQAAILALRAKAAAKAKRQAGKAAKAAEAGEGEGASA